MNKSDRLELITCINMRICWIETGTVTHTRNDAIRFNESLMQQSTVRRIAIKLVTDDQESLLIQLKSLRKELQELP